MKTPRLRAVLRRLLLVGLPLGSIGCQCPDPVERTVWWRGSRGEVQTLVDRCRSTGWDCDALCEKIATLREGYTPSVSSCELVVDDDGTSGVRYTLAIECVGGRRPVGLSPLRVSTNVRADTAVGRWFAELAHLEAASIHAFDRLARELGAHGAPALARAARAAVVDEAHHALVVGALARAHGVAPETPRIVAPPERTLEDLAVENAAEGCVRETYGALVAMHQAERARDPIVRDAFAAIARDEAGHAALAWAVDRWAAERLPRAARRRVEAARREAADDVVARAGAEVPDELVAVAGLPDRAAARSLASAAQAALWT